MTLLSAMARHKQYLQCSRTFTRANLSPISQSAKLLMQNAIVFRHQRFFFSERGHGKQKRALTIDLLPKQIKDAKYAVRGAVVTKSMELEKQGRTIIPCNIGNPQAVGQEPISFPRQVLSYMLNPKSSHNLPEDVIERGDRYLKSIKKIGAYSNSKGHLCFRKDVANFLKQRDGGHAVDPEDIFMSDGASPSCKAIMSLLITNPNDAILIPYPPISFVFRNVDIIRRNLDSL